MGWAPPITAQIKSPTGPLGPFELEINLTGPSSGQIFGPAHWAFLLTLFESWALLEGLCHPIRCNFCYIYGHKSLTCLRKARQSQLTWPVKVVEGEGSREGNKLESTTPTTSIHISPPSTDNSTEEKTPASSSSSPSMANFAVDPRPHVPKGFSLVEQLLRPPTPSGGVLHRLLHSHQ